MPFLSHFDGFYFYLAHFCCCCICSDILLHIIRNRQMVKKDSCFKVHDCITALGFWFACGQRNCRMHNSRVWNIVQFGLHTGVVLNHIGTGHDKTFILMYTLKVA